MNQKPHFLHTTAALCTISAISGVMSTVFAFKTLIYYPDIHELTNGAFFSALGLVTMLPLLTATFYKWKEQDTNGKQSFDVSKGWFSLLIAASTTTLVNTAYYNATKLIDNNTTIGITALCGMIITTCAMRMYMDRIRQPLSNSLV
jgi:hypothetical protein